ncbi:DDE superfamily endonuclease [Popillia japonica]|uniref:DDE superfamily endonuclease n=1 Tax=Popillia japonica TaxID=7064 RepID=A0AAW1LAF8_POPJA
MGQGATATFKAYYLRRSFRKLIHETDDESSIKQFWKNYSIRYAVDNIRESWKELQSTTMNFVWKKIWPECIKSNEPEVSSLSEIRQNLSNNLGFEDLEEGDLVDLLDADREPLSNDELIQLEIDRALDKESDLEPAICIPTAKNLQYE